MDIDAAEFRNQVITAIIKNTSQKAFSIRSFLITKEVCPDTGEHLAVSKAFYIQERPIRSYPFEGRANIFGYLGEVDTNYLKNMPKMDM